MKTRDFDIRSTLHQNLKYEFKYQPSTVIVDELGLCQGEARIDVAVINGSMHGYEIKSERDTLDRLPKQIDIYNKVFDTMTIITGTCHSDKVCELTPEWWGIIGAEMDHGKTVKFFSIREPKTNPEVDPYSLVQLLWREEALDILKCLGLAKGFLSKSRIAIWNRLASSIPLDELKFYVRQQLKQRTNWRSD